MCTQFFNDIHKAVKSNPVDLSRNMMDYPKGQAWKPTKQIKYEKNLMRLLFDPAYTEYIGAFTAMVKTGEVYSDDNIEIVNGYIQGRKDRPRLVMVPPYDACGPMQVAQWYLFPWIRGFVKGFIHGLTGQELKEYIMRYIKEHWMSLSLDGSTYDAS